MVYILGEELPDPAGSAVRETGCDDMDSYSMRKRFTILLCIVLVAAVTAGCETTSKRDVGTGVGAALGALAGYQIDDGLGGLLIGAAVGGIAGRTIGGYMDDSDREKVAETLTETPAGETERWKNEDTGYQYAMTPTTGTYDRDDDQCRDFEQEVFIDGKREVIQASACRQSDEDPWAIEA